MAQIDTGNTSFCDRRDSWSFMEKKTTISLVVGISMAVISPLIVAGNSLIIVVIWKDPLKKLRSFTSSRILFSMAVADVLVGSILSPLHAGWSLLKGLRQKPTFSVGVPLAINAVLTSVSVGHVLLLTIERLFAVFAPLQYRVKITNRRVSIAAIAIWGYALVLGVLHGTLSDHFIIFSIIYTAQVLIEVSIIICANSVILYHFHNDSTRNHSNTTSIQNQPFYHREKRLCKSIALIVAVFFFCYTPWFIIDSVLYFCMLCHWNLDVLMKGLWFSLIFVYINSALNPFLYSWRLTRFRDSLKHLLSRTHQTATQEEQIELEQYDTKL